MVIYKGTLTELDFRRLKSIMFAEFVIHAPAWRPEEPKNKVTLSTHIGN